MGSLRLMLGEILPNALPPVLVFSSLVVAGAILFESAVAFLGLGDPNRASWGRLIGEGRELISTSWYICAVPGVAIMATVLALNLIGDGLNDALSPSSGTGDDSSRLSCLRYRASWAVAARGKNGIPTAGHISDQARSRQGAAWPGAGSRAGWTSRSSPVPAPAGGGGARPVDRAGRERGPGGRERLREVASALAIMRLLPDPPARITGGSVRLDGREVLTLPEREMVRLRGGTSR